MKKQKILVVLSGGQDSTTCLFFVKKNFPDAEIHAVTFDYNQRHTIELESAKNIARMAKVASHEIACLTPGILKGTSPLTDYSKDVEMYDDAESLPDGVEDTFVPGRNLLFLTLAANRAYVLGADTIVIGVSQEDFGGYPDCREKFLAAMEWAIQEAMGRDDLHISAPLVYLNKKETVLLASKLPGCLDALAMSHTCYNGVQPPCGKCHACLLRQKGFDEAGIPDPMIERLDVTKHCRIEWSKPTGDSSEEHN